MSLRAVPTTLRVLARSGMLHPVAPTRLLGAAKALRTWGPNFAGGFAAAASRHGERCCVLDERGEITWGEVHDSSDALAVALARRGVGADSMVGVLCRNHRGFVIVTAALAKLGANALYLNTGFAGPQLREVLVREQAVAMLHDDEFTSLVGEGSDVPLTVVTWADEPTDRLTLDDLIAEGAGQSPLPSGRTGRSIILTSGTTGTPKGAPREQAAGVSTAVSLLERIPYRTGEKAVVPAPLFHSWGFGNLSLGLVLGSTFVLRRKFDPEQTLADIEHHRAELLVAVPVMLQRILELPEEVRRRYDTSSLRVVPLSGSAIPAGMATRWMDEFGDNLYNLYGSTEVGWATIATPEDLRVDPTTAGRPPLSTTVKILDSSGAEVPTGQVGRIFVGSDLTFDGYTGGGSKEVIDGLMSTGDTGRFDADGRLYVDGRDDEMVVSGGENVFPREVEDLLVAHPDVVEAAVVGIDDDEFGQALRAVVVVRGDAVLTEDDVRSHVRENLARFKVPRQVVFVDELPRNPTGKVLKRDL